jgi:hypothetical protein
MFVDCRTPPLLEPYETAIVDSGCMGHFLLVNAPCLNKVISQNPLTVRLPNGATMESTHTAALNIPELKKLHPLQMFSLEWRTILYFLLANFEMRDIQSLSGTNRSQFTIRRNFKF